MASNSAEVQRKRASSPDRLWSATLDRAERLLRAGNVRAAQMLARSVYDAAVEDRAAHPLGTEARWACTQAIARAVTIMARVARPKRRDTDERAGSG